MGVLQSFGDQDFQIPITSGCVDPVTIEPFAVTRRSSPAFFWSSANASWRPNHALARALACAEFAPDCLSAIDERLSSPTAMIVRRIISDRVTTKAKPRETFVISQISNHSKKLLFRH